MFKKLKVSVLFLAVVGLVLGTMLNQGAKATVPGTNNLANYTATSSTTPSSGGGNLKSHISDDGKVIIWYSYAHDVVPSDPYTSSTAANLYTRNLQTGATSYVNTNLSGAPADVKPGTFAMSRTGRYVAYSSIDTNIVSTPVLTDSNRTHLYLKDMQLGTTTFVDQTASGVPANLDDGAASYAKSVSDDGRFVLFTSESNNLLSSGNDSTKSGAYYIKDMQTGQVINPAVSNAGVRSNATTALTFSSCDGELIALGSSATNLTPQDDGQTNVYLVDIRNGYNITNLTYATNASVSLISMSCNGRYLVVNSLATNLTSDTVSGTKAHYFRYDRLTGNYELIDKSTSGYISSTINPNSNGTDAMRTVSDDGKVVFRSNEKNMISPAALRLAEVYLRNPEAGTTELVPVNASGVEQNQTGGADTLEINSRGDTVIYTSNSTNLIPGVTSGGALVLSKIQ